jgi:hypothetical protein
MATIEKEIPNATQGKVSKSNLASFGVSVGLIPDKEDYIYFLSDSDSDFHHEFDCYEDEDDLRNK